MFSTTNPSSGIITVTIEPTDVISINHDFIKINDVDIKSTFPNRLSIFTTGEK